MSVEIKNKDMKGHHIFLDAESSKERGQKLMMLKILRNIFPLVATFWLGVSCYWIFNVLAVSQQEPAQWWRKDAPICSGIADVNKFDCYPDAPVTEQECIQRGCCYHAKTELNDSFGEFPPLNVPYCFYPSNYEGYKVTSIIVDDKQYKATLRRMTPSGFPYDVQDLQLVISFIDDHSLEIKITGSTRFEVPLPLHYLPKKRQNQFYDVYLDSFGNLQVKRISSGTVVFQTDLSVLVYSDQFIQLSTILPTPYFYGIGEHYDGVLRNVNWTRYTLFNRDIPPQPNTNLYGSQPFYMVLENDGNASGVFLYNSNAMDVILQPTPAVTWRPIGGVLDFFIFLGPSPENVVQQYTNIVGRTFMPPYWSFGFQLCRFGYGSVNRTREVWNKTVATGIPFDVQWNDIDYMDHNKDFTYDPVNFNGLPQFVQELHDQGMHYVIMTDPGISGSEKPGSYPPYDDGLLLDLFIKDANGKIFEGKVWTSGKTVFPDFSHPNTSNYWEKQFRRLHTEVEFDGVWIDMNEPSNFYDGTVNGCPNSTYENPPYLPGGSIPLYTKTVCMTAKHYHTIHYNEHNLLSIREAIATNHALQSIRKKRPFIISRATFPGQGYYSGHWSGDVSSSWEDMRYTIPSMLNFNMYGIPMIGSDICGFNGNTTVELCARWQSLGAFYPFSRNHNTRAAIAQDPVSLGPTVVAATKYALLARYTLLPYLYTLFYKSHVFGDTVAKPIFFEYPLDSKTYNLNEQFLWGPALMIIPVLYPGVTKVTAYFPKDTWYDFHSGEKRISKGETFTLSIPITNISLSIRGGYILPLQIPAQTTTASRLNDFILVVALNNNKAVGELYWDDGDSIDTYGNGAYNLIEFTAKDNSLNSTITKLGYQTQMNLSEVKVHGVDKKPSQVTINGQKCSFQFSQGILSINAEGFTLMKPVTVLWH